MPIMEISVVPIGTKTPSISKYVAASEEILQKTNTVKSQITAMATIVESDSLNKLFDIARKMHEKVLSSGAKRVITSITIDDRLDKKLSIEGKVNSVKKKLGEFR